MIDAHIHLERYEPYERERLLRELASDPGQVSSLKAASVSGKEPLSEKSAFITDVEALVAVSMDLASSRRTAELAAAYPNLVKPAYGFHPEQEIPDEAEISRLLDWIRGQARGGGLTAVGEIGLPYYLRTEKQAAGEQFALQPYIEVLGRFLALAAELDKPVALHAVYEDADIVCDLLERFGVKQAHFHWFKGAEQTVRRMAERGYFISFTPDIVYEEEIQQLAAIYPAELVMAETDGPWPFEGPFAGRMTHPGMIGEVAAAWGQLHGLSREEAAGLLTANTHRFYGI